MPELRLTTRKQAASCLEVEHQRLVAGERIASRLETSFRLGLEFRFHTSRRCDWQRNRINGRRLGTARPFPLRRLHSGPQSSSFRSMSGNAPRTPESSVADAMRTSVVTRNYRQINSRVATRNSSGTDFKSHRSPEGFPRFANILSWSGSRTAEPRDPMRGAAHRSIPTPSSNPASRASDSGPRGRALFCIYRTHCWAGPVYDTKNAGCMRQPRAAF